MLAWGEMPGPVYVDEDSWRCDMCSDMVFGEGMNSVSYEGEKEAPGGPGGRKGMVMPG